MGNQSDVERPARLASWLLKAGIATAVLATAGLVVALSYPISAGEFDLPSAEGWPVALPAIAKPDLSSFLAEMAGRRLFRPAQIQAAVKDTGLARKLLGGLTLCGVTQIGNDRLAYVKTKAGAVKKVKVGEKVLDFVVEQIEPGQLTLSLDGVNVKLTH